MFVRALAWLVCAVVPALAATAQGTPQGSAVDARGRASLAGVVRGEDGQPLSGATVALPALARVATTDADGSYRLRDLPASPQTIVVRALGRTPATVRRALAAGRNIHDVTLEPATITLIPVVVTGAAATTDPTTPLDLAAVDESQLRQTSSASLGKTLERIPGIATVTTGPMAGNPVLRGMSQGQIRLTRDGVAVESFQGTSRWTPPISFGSVERVEVIRGPASVLYGSSAMGGTINFLPKPLPRADDDRATLDALVEAQYHTNNGERLLGGELAGALPGGVGARAGLHDRKAGNFMTAAADPYAVTQRRHDPRFTGRLPYTNYEQLTSYLQLGHSAAWGQAQVLYDGFDGSNNFLNANGRPAGVRMANHEGRARAIITGGRWVFKPSLTLQALRIQRAASAQLTYEQARANDAWDQDLGRRVVTSRLEAEHASLGGASGKLGLEAQRQEGSTRLSRIEPSSRMVNLAAFAFEEWRTARTTLSLGARFDHRRQRAESGSLVAALPVAEHEALLHRTFSVVNGSLGAGVGLAHGLTWIGSVSTGFRAPSAQDLYTDENRPAFGWLEGNPRLSPERSLNIETGMRYQGARATGQVMAYRNRVRDYVYMRNTGRTRVVRNEERLVYANAQADAVIRGLEASGEGEIVPRLFAEASYMMLRSRNLSTSESLPLMPADQARISLRYTPRERGPFTVPLVRVGMRYVGPKRIAGPTEPFAEFDANPAGYGISSTPAYRVAEASLATRLSLGTHPLDVSVDIQNLFDTPYRDFLDTQKGFALAQGRNVSVRISAPLRLVR